VRDDPDGAIRRDPLPQLGEDRQIRRVIGSQEDEIGPCDRAQGGLDALSEKVEELGVEAPADAHRHPLPDAELVQERS
jgi:hypothetical protein